MKRQTTVRLEDADLILIDTEAREAGITRADYLRTLILRRPTQNRSVDAHAAAHLEARLARMETLLMAAVIAAHEVQVVTRGNLTPDRAKKAVAAMGDQIAAWRARGFLSAADLDPNTMLTKKESPNE